MAMAYLWLWVGKVYLREGKAYPSPPVHTPRDPETQATAFNKRATGNAASLAGSSDNQPSSIYPRPRALGLQRGRTTFSCEE